MNIEEVLEDIKRHLDYVNATNQTSIRDNQIKVMYEEIERLNNIIKEFEILIKNEINESKFEDDYDRVDAMEYCLATLKELKGSNGAIPPEVIGTNGENGGLFDYGDR